MFVIEDGKKNFSVKYCAGQQKMDEFNRSIGSSRSSSSRTSSSFGVALSYTFIYVYVESASQTYILRIDQKYKEDNL